MFQTTTKRVITINNLPIIAQKVILNKKNYEKYIKLDFVNLSISGIYNYNIFNNSFYESNLHLLGMNNKVINEKCFIKNYRKYTHINYSLKYSGVENNKLNEHLELNLLDNIDFDIYLDHDSKLPDDFWCKLSNTTRMTLNEVKDIIRTNIHEK